MLHHNRLVHFLCVGAHVGHGFGGVVKSVLHTLAQQMVTGAKRTALLASLASIRTAGASAFTALITKMQSMPASILSCTGTSGCQRASLNGITRTYDRKVLLLNDKLSKLAKALRKAGVGASLASQIDKKRAQLLSKAQSASAKLPGQTYNCPG